MIIITSTSDLIAEHLKLISGIPEVKISPYRQIFQQLLDPDSLFRQNQGTTIILIFFEDWLSSEPARIVIIRYGMEYMVRKKKKKAVYIAE